MPSMRLPPPATRDSDRTGPINKEARQSRLFVAGRTREERDELVRLLARSEGHGRSRNDTDLSHSFLSTKSSDKSRNSSRHARSDEWDDLIEEMPFRTHSTTFHQPRSSFPTTTSSSGAAELAERLQGELERKERFIDRTYPSTQSLADFIAKGSDGILQSALMLFSSRKSSSTTTTSKPEN